MSKWAVMFQGRGYEELKIRSQQKLPPYGNTIIVDAKNQDKAEMKVIAMLYWHYGWVLSLDCVSAIAI